MMLRFFSSLASVVVLSVSMTGFILGLNPWNQFSILLCVVVASILVASKVMRNLSPSGLVMVPTWRRFDRANGSDSSADIIWSTALVASSVISVLVVR